MNEEGNMLSCKALGFVIGLCRNKMIF